MDIINVKRKCLNWCKKFLSGTWTKLTEHDIEIQQIRGALTNYVYLCQLSNNIDTKPHEHRKVLLRLYGEISGSHEKFYEILIFNMLSERRLGPRLLGAFKSGRLEQYFDSRTLTVQDLRNGTFLEIIARKMAKFHLIQAPIDKRPIFIQRLASKYIPYVSKAFEDFDKMTPRHKEIIGKMKSMNLLEEYRSLLEIIEKMGSVPVFCHNDVQEGNILVVNSNGEKLTENDVQIIDFEYSYYGYRAYDIGNHFCEWVMENVSNKPLAFDYDISSYPSNEQQIKFCRAYLDCVKDSITSQHDPIIYDPALTPEQLAYEVNIHSLMSHLFWGFWGVTQHYLSKIEFDFLEYSFVRFELYFHFKKTFYPGKS